MEKKTTTNGSNGKAHHPAPEVAPPATARGQSARIEIPALKLAILTLTLKGDSPLIMHAFPQKIQEQMLAKHMGAAQQKREKKVPEADFIACLHFIGKAPKLKKSGDVVTATGRWGFPAGGIRAAAISACRQVEGLKMTYARGVFAVVADDVSKNLVEVFGEPIMRRDVTRNSNGQPDIRFRAEFPEWSIKLTVKYDTKCISPSQLANLFNQAGFSVGLGDWRPERDGDFGRFSVAGTDELMIGGLA